MNKYLDNPIQVIIQSKDDTSDIIPEGKAGKKKRQTMKRKAAGRDKASALKAQEVSSHETTVVKADAEVVDVLVVARQLEALAIHN
jgi:hypothetical protein